MMNRTHMQVGLLSVFGILILAVADAQAADVSGKLTMKKKKYQKNAVVYLEGVQGKFAVSKKPVEMDQRDQTFIPFVLPIVQGATVEFLNHDNTGHNVFSPDGERYDLGTWGEGESKKYTFKKTGVYTQLCKMHPSMIAYIVVLANPYFAVTGDDGSFTIKDVPAGSYTIKVWHERKKVKDSKVTVPASGRVEVGLGG